MTAELRLPQHLIDKAIRSNNEYGWKQDDVLDVIESARKIHLATIGGQVQYVLPNATCELYWLSYDSSERKDKEDWLTYCDRSAFECSGKFQQLIKRDIERDAITSFAKMLSHNGKPIDNLNDYQVFILYFDDKETDEFAQK